MTRRRVIKEHSGEPGSLSLRLAKKPRSRLPNLPRAYSHGRCLIKNTGCQTSSGAIGMSALGQKRTCAVRLADVRFVPKADIERGREIQGVTEELLL